MSSTAEEIRSKLKDFQSYYNNSPINFEAIAELYTEDCKLLPAGGPAVSGLAGVMEDMVATSKAGITAFILLDIDIHQLADNVAVTNGKWALEWKETNERRLLKDVVVWKRINGTWKIFQDIFNFNN